jgi:hypothetical protein
MRLLLAVAVTVAVAFASYASAAPVIFTNATDPDVRCDTDGVAVSGWSLLASLGDVDAVELTEIDPSCVGSELYVLLMQDGSPLADGSFIVDSSDTGANVANVPFTNIGASTAPRLVSAEDITGISILLHRGSEPAIGPSDMPCELLGMSIEGWGLDSLSAMVSSIRLVDIAPQCIGNEIVVVLDQNGTVVGDGRALLSNANTDSEVLVVSLTEPGGGTVPLAVHASVITGIQIYVEGELADEEPGVDGGPDLPPAVPGPSVTFDVPPALSGSTAEVQGIQIIPQGRDDGEQSTLVDEIGGVRRVPGTGSGGLLNRDFQGSAALHGTIVALALGLLIAVLALRKSRHRRDS